MKREEAKIDRNRNGKAIFKVAKKNMSKSGTNQNRTWKEVKTL